MQKDVCLRNDCVLIGQMDNPTLLLIEASSNPLFCRNPSLGLATKAKGLQGCGSRLSPESHSHALGNAKECERKNPHTPK